MAKRSSILIFKALALVVLVLAVKLFAGHLASVPTRGLAGLEAQETVDWLVVGTSHVDSGYDIPWLEAQTGQRFYALWYSGMNPMELEIVLDEVLANSHIKFKNLVLDMTSGGMASPPHLWDSDLFWDLPPRAKARLLPLIAEHYGEVGWRGILQLLFAHRSAELLTFAWNRPLLASRYHHGSRKFTKTSMQATKWKYLRPNPRFLVTQGEIRPEYEAALKRLLAKLALRPDLKIWAIETPMAAVSLHHPSVIMLQQRLQALVNEQLPQATYRGANDWSEFDISQYQFFNDDHHLSQKGRGEFSRVFYNGLLRPRPTP